VESGVGGCHYQNVLVKIIRDLFFTGVANFNLAQDEFELVLVKIRGFFFHFSFLFGGFYYKNSAFPMGMLIIVVSKFSACGGLGDKFPPELYGSHPRTGESGNFQILAGPLEPPSKFENTPRYGGDFRGRVSPP